MAESSKVPQWKVQEELRAQRRAKKRRPKEEVVVIAQPYKLYMRLADTSAEGRRRAYEKLRVWGADYRKAFIHHDARQAFVMKGEVWFDTTTDQMATIIETLSPEWRQGRVK